MGKHIKKSTLTKPLFKYYANRKIYHANESRYVTLSEVYDIVKASNGDFDIDGMEKRKLVLKLLTQTSENNLSTDVLLRAITHGGLGAYISKLESLAGVEEFKAPVNMVQPETNQLQLV